MDTNAHTADLVDWAIKHGRIGFSLQTVTTVADTGETLYAECLGRIVLPRGLVLTAEEFVEELEASGRTAAYDRHMLSLAAEWLAHHPDGMLGCDVSVGSILDERECRRMLDLLGALRPFAGRLILELTINRPIGTLTIVKTFCREAAALGYRIALDRFGVDHAPAETLLAHAFDIVKIDSVFPVVAHDRPFRPLYQLVGLALAATPLVVVAGVETYAQLDIAHMAGATHVQGFLLSEPTLAPVFGYGAPLSNAPRGPFDLVH